MSPSIITRIVKCWFCFGLFKAKYTIEFCLQFMVRLQKQNDVFSPMLTEGQALQAPPTTALRAFFHRTLDNKWQNGRLKDN